eukprot:TRINITY_DN67870_c0_g1_i1.p1 TRINITY_DN67870_c0_g1~~TRINITY_DN67870_c0_g1_i1.p1  ORF type:complete len:368 (+),score=64.03 TRINITY_DN67870_c0_g1_i1:71-1174(+)
MGALLTSEYNHKQFEEGFGKKVFDDTLSQLPSLAGKCIAITGCTTGFGFHLAEAAVKKGAAHVLLLNRKSERATEAEKKVKEFVAEAKTATKVETVECDLQSFSSTKACAEKVQAVAKTYGGLDVLANNAGVMALRDVRTDDGFEVQMQTNQLSHVLLLHGLLPSLDAASKKRGESRVVFHSSSARDQPAGDLHPEFFQKCGENTLGGDDTGMMSEMLFGSRGPWQRYHQTKLANAAFAMSLHDRLKDSPYKAVKVLAVDPGVASTNLQQTSVDSGLMGPKIANMLMGMGQSAEDGCAPLMMACFSSDAKSGDFYAPDAGMKGVPIKTISEGVPVKSGSEKLTTSQANKDTAWNSTLAACNLTSLWS